MQRKPGQYTQLHRSSFTLVYRGKARRTFCTISIDPQPGIQMNHRTPGAYCILVASNPYYQPLHADRSADLFGTFQFVAVCKGGITLQQYGSTVSLTLRGLGSTGGVIHSIQKPWKSIHGGIRSTGWWVETRERRGILSWSPTVKFLPSSAGLPANNSSLRAKTPA